MEPEHPLQIKKIIPPTVEVYYADPFPVPVGTLNEYEFFDLRAQIKENNIQGYFIIFNDCRYIIKPDGSIQDHPEKLFDLIPNYLDKVKNWN